MESIIGRLVDIQYTRNDYDFHRGTFRVRGDVLEIIPAYQDEKALHIEFYGDEIDAIREIDPLTGEVLGRVPKTVIYPASHYVSDRDNLIRAMSDIRDELRERLIEFNDSKRLLEAQRLEQRTQLDLEMMEELGYCNGIENYSRHLDGRTQGQPPATLLDYFPKDFLLFVDESHMSIPQVGAMFKGDRSRKNTLVDYGFRLPSALDNRPLQFAEFEERIGQSIFVSATPGRWELDRSAGLVVEQVIRPTGLVDPPVEIRPVKGQMDDLLGECKARAARGERVLVTTLTKRMAEDLTEYFNEMGVSSRYLHSDIDTLERIAIIKALRAKEFDVLVGINLLREGLDIPEVSLVAILDADKEGFLRSTGALIQTFGRAARNAEGRVILYADRVTASMKAAMDETERRRAKQLAYNEEHGIEPKTILKSLENPLDNLYGKDEEGKTKRGKSKADARADKGKGRGKKKEAAPEAPAPQSPADIAKLITELEKAMRAAAKQLEFEQAAEYRDRIKALKERLYLSGEENLP